ncbi:MAG TPA: ATP-dependent DNA ligase [Actinomycetes bacterium]|nr:ATP-dependent DNA ligase [Actinomycetes bacterium]
MTLPIKPPIAPMLAKPVKDIPEPSSIAGGVHFEPKWDGFRCIIFKDGDHVELSGRSESITRYFPEMVAAAQQLLPSRVVLDGELVIAADDHLDFDALQLRIHPADSRVQLLSGQIPASYVAFDVLAHDDESLLARPFGDRRRLLERLLKTVPPPFYATPVTTDRETAAQWFSVFEGAGLDGLIAKPLADPYQPGKRTLLKIKHERTADCVLAGYREHKSGGSVGSLLLGLYDEAGVLHHVGVASSFTAARRTELVEELAPLVTDLEHHPWKPDTADAAKARRPGALNRWNAGKNMEFVALRPERVVEVAYDQLQGDRFRHTARFRRWRPDRKPASCTYDQLDRPVAYHLADVLTPHTAG